MLSALCRHKVEFLVLGTVARFLEGDLCQRPRDLGVAPDQSVDNLERLAACLNELEVYAISRPWSA